MDKETLKTIVIIGFIVLSAGAIISYACWKDGYAKGIQAVYRQISLDTAGDGDFDLWVENETTTTKKTFLDIETCNKRCKEELNKLVGK